MLKSLKNLIGGGGNEAEIKKLDVVARRIVDELSPKYEELSDSELKANTEKFRERLAKGEKLDTILPDAFANIRDAAWRVRKMKPYKVQLIGGMVLNQGKIAEMRTGEGKTLVATLSAYLNALDGQGVHIVTVNDYLVRRDCQWMGPIYDRLGLTVAIIQSNGGNPATPDAYLLDVDFENEADPAYRNLRPIPRREAYKADILFGTNNEFGFDYLRDNMARDMTELVQRPLNYAIVDEVDNILIDEARTPLIISGKAERAQDDYVRFSGIARQLRKGTDYEVDEKKRTVNVMDRGIDRVEQILGIPSAESIYDDKWSHYVSYLENALKAKELYLVDREYVMRDKDVVIVDEFTGRLQEGRRWEGGLHQAIEAKEGVHVANENMTYATITLQNYFRMYNKLSGMTGTAATEAEEFIKIYGLDVITIPTNKDMSRKDYTDLIYRNEEAKYRAVIEEIEEMHVNQRPVLVGTTSVEKSELLSARLKKMAIPHSVLNAKLHEKEAGIIAQAGRPGSVTIATNMAGRGTDIILGGSQESFLERELQERNLTSADQGTEAYQQAEAAAQQAWDEAHHAVVQAGGLHIIGTERHESRRIDNQLRGRAGRQGDPGSSRFYVSLEDELMRRFGSERIGGLLERFGFDEETAIENSVIAKTIEQAQTKVEGQNFDYRKYLVEFDNVMNKQRAVIYEDRKKVLEGESQRERVLEITNLRLAELMDEYLVGEQEEWDFARLIRNSGLILQTAPLDPALFRGAKTKEQAEDIALIEIEKQLNLAEGDLVGKSKEEIKTIFADIAEEAYNKKLEEEGAEDLQVIERLVMLQVIDRNWVNYLTPMEELRRGIGLRAYGQQDPLQAYKRAAFQMWNDLQNDIKREIVQEFWPAKLQKARSAPPPPRVTTNSPEQVTAGAKANGTATNGVSANGSVPVAVGANGKVKLGPNEPCYCGSGKKFKKCHGSVV